jgi:hypothetical protein
MYYWNIPDGDVLSALSTSPIEVYVFFSRNLVFSQLRKFLFLDLRTVMLDLYIRYFQIIKTISNLIDYNNTMVDFFLH